MHLWPWQGKIKEKQTRAAVCCCHVPGKGEKTMSFAPGIFNDVLSPVSPGPSSSNTCANAALGGLDALIPLDDAVQLMLSVGEKLRPCNRAGTWQNAGK